MQSIIDSPEAKDLEAAARYWLAEAQFRKQDYAAAANSFELLQEDSESIDPNWLPTIGLRRAQIAGLREDWSEALQVAEELVAIQDQLAQPFELDYLIGRSKSAMGRFTEARQAFGKVIRSPEATQTETAAKAQWMIGESYFHQEQYQEAIDAFEKVEVLYSFDEWRAAAILQAGKCYERLEKAQQAAKYYSRLLREYPDSTYSTQAAELLRLAQSQSQAQR